MKAQTPLAEVVILWSVPLKRTVTSEPAGAIPMA
jgi:hypothetical protein